MGNRNKIFLATKFGIVRTPGRVANGTPEYVKASAKKSLKRLGIETIDLYYVHVRFYLLFLSQRCWGDADIG